MHFDNLSLISSYNEKCYRKKVLEKIKTYFMINNLFIKPCHFEIMWKNIVRAGEATDDNTIRHEYCMLRLQVNNRKMQHFLIFHRDSGCTNTPICCVIRTLLVLFLLTLSFSVVKYQYKNLPYLFICHHKGRPLTCSEDTVPHRQSHVSP